MHGKTGDNKAISSSAVWRIALVAVLVAGVIAFFAFGLQRYLTLEALKARADTLAALRAAHPLALAAAFFAIYVAVTALSLPGAALLTLAAGALFGLIEGVLLVSFASSIGATLAFLSSRFVFRDAVRRRFGERLEAIDAGVDKGGAFYLFTLRLVPLFPFFVINLVMGLTSLSMATFYWVSQVGMLAGTVVYVNAGTQLARLDSLSGILSPTLIGSFVLLGVFPLIARFVVHRIQVRRVYRKWTRPKRYDRNLVVIGAGSAGLVSAYIAATVRAGVTLVERAEMGGDCLNTGCVPSKALIRSARLVADLRAARKLGLRDADPDFDFADVMQRVQRVIAEVAPHDSIERYRTLGVDVRRGVARITTPWCVEIDGDPVTTRAIVIAAGAEPLVPPIDGLDRIDYLTSENVWSLRELPARLVVLGGGPIGCELAQAFARFGSGVSQVELTGRLLPREDDEVSAFVRARLEGDGVRVLTGHKALAIERDGRENVLVCETGPDGTHVRIAFDALLIAVGRKPRTSGYGLEELGIPVSGTGTVEADAALQTLYPNIYVCGDVAGPYQFTHVGAHQAWYATVNALFGGFRRFRADYSVIPAVTFTDPEIARVGINEREAKERNIACEVTRYDLGDLDRAITEGAARGFLKILTPPGKDRILGATIVGEHAGELLAEFTLAMKHKLGLDRILATIHAYPTWAEANKYAAGAWKKAHAPETALRWLARYHAWRRG
ncbi:MAG TPA: FAD-dependent oxidoreductase [Rhodanobacteraceae bacterium]|nr:FAD-dependent oxidoreductase [Rhodanobacteraceae bacterium]